MTKQCKYEIILHSYVSHARAGDIELNYRKCNAKSSLQYVGKLYDSLTQDVLNVRA